MGVRCYIPPEQWQELCEVKGNPAHHLLHVLRVRPNQRITCFDGLGNEAQGLVTRIGRQSLFLRLGPLQSIQSEEGLISLGVALPRGGRLDRIVNQATQLGVRELIPIATARGVVRLTAAGFEKKRKRLSQIAVEAAKQSGVDWLPQIQPLVSWKGLLELFHDDDLILLASLEGPHENLQRLLSDARIKRVLILIGPEGDFTPEEISSAVSHGAHRISLSAHTLRCETAAVVAVGLVSFLLQR